MIITQLSTDIMGVIRHWLNSHHLFLLDLALSEVTWREVTDDELEAARHGQEEFEAFDDSYYDNLYDGRWGEDGGGGEEYDDGPRGEEDSCLTGEGYEWREYGDFVVED
jgi:hypothetical protein